MGRHLRGVVFVCVCVHVRVCTLVSCLGTLVWAIRIDCVCCLGISRASVCVF